MATPSDQDTPAARERRESPRTQLARLAHATALAQPEITGGDAGTGGVHATFAADQRLPGVVVMPDGVSFSVDLYLTAEPCDLTALGARVSASVRQAADAAGLGDALGAVRVTFTDLTLPDESAHA